MIRSDKAVEPVFPFGKNWKKFLADLTEQKVGEAQRSLRLCLGREDLSRTSFLDIGSGSGLFSLAAVLLGAEPVLSFDYDPECVACTQALKERYLPGADHWTICQGDVLDPSFLKGLGEWDILYSWGVLHHTGNLWRGLEHLPDLVKKGGVLLLAVYNDQGWKSRYWLRVKKGYNRNFLLRMLIIFAHAPFLLGGPWLLRLWRGKRLHERERGMSLWRDYLDWLGGYPFETAKPEKVIAFFKKRGFRLKSLKSVGNKLGCNEFLFEKETSFPAGTLEK